MHRTSSRQELRGKATVFSILKNTPVHIYNTKIHVIRTIIVLPILNFLMLNLCMTLNLLLQTTFCSKMMIAEENNIAP